MTKAFYTLKSETSKNKLSYLWWVIEPILYMSVFYLVFGMLLKRGGENYIPYLLVGLVAFQWFAKTCQSCSSSILQGKNLLLNININPLFFPLVNIVVCSIRQIPVFLMLFIFLLIYGYSITEKWIILPVVIFIELMVITSISIIPALIVPYLRDVGQLVPTFIQFMLFVSGTFIPFEDIPIRFREIFLLNPIASLLHLYRVVVIDDQWPETNSIIYLICFSSVILLSIYIIFKGYCRNYARLVSE